jgi:CheY-like chemotaxis protein
VTYRLGDLTADIIQQAAETTTAPIAIAAVSDDRSAVEIIWRNGAFATLEAQRSGRRTGSLSQILVHAMLEASATGAAVTRTIRGDHGGRIALRLTKPPRESGAPVWFVGIEHDLEEAQDRIDALEGANAAGAWTMAVASDGDLGRGIRWFSADPGMLSLLGVDELDSFSAYRERLHADDSAAEIARIEAALTRGGGYESTIRLVAGDGAILRARVNLAVRFGTGERRAACVIRREAAADAPDAPDERLTEIRRLAAEIAGGVPARSAETAAARISALADQMLGLAPTGAPSAPFSLRDIAAALESRHAPDALAKGLDFSVTVAECCVAPRRGDARALSALLDRVTARAVAATEAGSVRLTVGGPAEEGDDPDLVRIVATDTSPGPEPDSPPDPDGFQQAAAALGGGAQIVGEKGVGSVVILDLRLPPVEPEDALHAAFAAPHDGPLRVLIVDDVPLNRDVASELLESAVHADVTAVSSARAALDRHATQVFDLVLMDIQMPVMDGFQAMRAIRSREKRGESPRTPIVAMTAFGASRDHANYEREGFDALLLKPLDRAVMCDALRRALGPERANRLLRV